MILLDTDHVTLLKYPANELATRLRGRLDAVARERAARRQVPAYRELANLFEFYAEFTVAPFDDRAADQFDELRAGKIRLGTMDLKIAATALAQQGLLLSANRTDFVQVLGCVSRTGWTDRVWLRPPRGPGTRCARRTRSCSTAPAAPAAPAAGSARSPGRSPGPGCRS